MELDELIELMKSKTSKWDLEDYELLDNNERTRLDVGIGEYFYGITMVPCKWVLPYLEELQKIKKEK